jgi:hypothetical protein
MQAFQKFGALIQDISELLEIMESMLATFISLVDSLFTYGNYLRRMQLCRFRICKKKMQQCPKPLSIVMLQIRADCQDW